MGVSSGVVLPNDAQGEDSKFAHAHRAEALSNLA
jgi:hypothetical protein